MAAPTTPCASSSAILFVAAGSSLPESTLIVTLISSQRALWLSQAYCFVNLAVHDTVQM